MSCEKCQENINKLNDALSLIGLFPARTRADGQTLAEINKAFDLVKEVKLDLIEQEKTRKEK